MLEKLKDIPYDFYLLCLAIATFPIWPLKAGAFVIIVWFVFCIALRWMKPEFIRKQNLKKLLLFSLLFILYLVYFLLVDSPEGTFHTLERRLSLFAFPLGFYLAQQDFTAERRINILRAFEWAALILTIYIAVNIIPLIVKYWEVIQIGTGFNWAFRTEVEKLINIHPTYLSIFLFFTVFLKMNRYFEGRMSRKTSNLVFEQIQVLLMLTCCLFLSARGPIISFALAMSIYLVQLNWKRSLLTIAIVVPILVLLFSVIPPIGKRFFEFDRETVTEKGNYESNSTEIRKKILECSLELLRDHWLMGLGPGNLQGELNDRYESKGYGELKRKNFNTHNEYLEVWLTLGLIGLIVFLAMLLLPLYYSFLLNDRKYQFFLILMACCFMTENLLARQHGVVFYAFLNTLFAYRETWSFKR